jgi:uncharacterized membrane protein
MRLRLAMRTIVFMGAAVLVVLHTGVASADGKLCNNSCGAIWAAYGEQFSDSGKDWVAGWWRVQPGQCATVIQGDVCNWWANVWGNCSNNELGFAFDDAGHQWGGSVSICTTFNAFDENPDYNTSCPAGRSALSWGQVNYSHPNNDVTINVPCPGQ